jgi:tRNA dimethylallyltransferase
MTARSRLVVIIGPTASGKSALGVKIAERFSGEILVCDSTQVYRGFDIGTAKVPLAERRGIPHHLMDLVDPREVFTAGEYRRQALLVLDDLRRCEKLPVITAGTGLYLRALLEGLAEAPTRSEELRERLRQIESRRGQGHLHRILARLDREASKRIAPRDSQKIIRAIELRILTGKKVGDIHRSGRSALQGYVIKKIGLLPPRAALYERIESRTVAMIDAGWIDEVRQLVANGVPLDAKPFQFIGYSQLRDVVDGRLRKEDAIKQIQQATRNFAKRQITWFRKETGVQWLEGFGDDPETTSAAVSIIDSSWS